MCSQKCESQFAHIVSDGNDFSSCTSGIFVSTLALEVLAVDFLSFLRLADIACKLGKRLSELLLRLYHQPLPISKPDRSHPAFSADLLSHRKGALALDLFFLVELPLTDGEGMSGRSSLPTQ